MRQPTSTRTGAIASFGITLNNGIKNKAGINKSPAVKEVNPVFPPAAIPVADSAAVVIGLQPKIPAMTTEMAFA